MPTGKAAEGEPVVPDAPTTFLWGKAAANKSIGKISAYQRRPDVQRMFSHMLFVLRSYMPHTNYKAPPKTKIHHEIRPKRFPLHNRNTKNTRNIRKSPNFVCFSLLSVFRFWRVISGVLRGVLWGSEAFCILYGGSMITMFVTKWFPIELKKLKSGVSNGNGYHN